jgi:Arc/MetJ family transcription regulator
MQQKPKQIQIPEALLIELCKWHLCDGCQTSERAEYICKALRDKLDAAARRNLYSTMHDASKSSQDREKARQRYLDDKGIPESFRW